MTTTDPPRKLTGRPATRSTASRHPGRIAAAVLLAFAAAVPCARADSPSDAPAATEQPADPYAEACALLDQPPPKRDIARITRLLDAAAAAGSRKAKLKLAEYHYLGVEGFPRNHAAAFPHVRDLAEAGQPWAQNTMGAMFEFGQVVESNRTNAVHWYREAAMQNHTRAMANLGRLLRSGRPADQDVLQALVWLKLAASRGETGAVNTLEDISSAIPQARIRTAERLAEDIEAEIRKRQQTGGSAAPGGGDANVAIPGSQR